VFEFKFHEGGIFLPALGLWLDPHFPQTGPDRVFVSHAHSDHIDAHREVILSGPTAKLMQARLPGARLEHIVPFREKRTFSHGSRNFDLTLLPAGHIFGSAMSLIEVSGKTLLYTGDFKLRRGLSAEPCEPQHADVLIMETTYGRAQYRFPPTADVIAGVVRFCKQALDNDETPVLLGYSLGKSQELLCSLGDAGLPIMLHGTVYKLTQIYEQFGHCFPPYEAYEAGKASGKVLLCPPSVAGSAMLRKIGRVRVAVLTGWAVDQGCRFRYGADAAFPLSDHADFPDLVEFVKQVQPSKVYTLHGFAADFAQCLRELGFDAQALSEEEQMSLPLPAHPVSAKPAATKPSNSTGPKPAPLKNGTESFTAFAQTCVAIASTSSKLQKIAHLADYLRGVKPDSLVAVVTWFTGAPFASTENKVMQLGWATLRDALCTVGEVTPDDLHHVYLKHSDLGETACEVLSHRGDPAAPALLSLETVAGSFARLQAARGPSAKLPLMIELLRQASAIEAKFLVKILTSDLRIGLKEGLVEEAIAKAFDASAEEVRRANLLLGNAGETALLAKQHRLASASLIPFRPIKFMLASPEPTAADIWERIQAAAAGRTASPEESKEARAPGHIVVRLEDKYDGIRCQLHRSDGRVALYSRDLKEITGSFPEIAEAARRLPRDVILDGEILAMRGDEVLPFAVLQRRLGRREPDLFMREEFPIKFVAFDLLWETGHSKLNEPLRTRWEALQQVQPLPEEFRLVNVAFASSADEIHAAFEEARARNNEGLMIKDTDSAYTPGRRGLSWLKLKMAFDTLDCVVVGAEYGHGKRRDVLSDYTFAVRDENTGELKTIGKAYSGLTDVEIAELTTHFLNRVVHQYGRYHDVIPDTVLEIAFDRLQPSKRHSSGLAMRFPRILRIRRDKTPAQIDTVESARRLVRSEATERAEHGLAS
jgi:DNA ligase-1